MRGLINERRDRLKASVQVNGGHFERCMIALPAALTWTVKIFLKFQFCEKNDVIDFTD